MKTLADTLAANEAAMNHFAAMSGKTCTKCAYSFQSAVHGRLVCNPNMYIKGALHEAVKVCTYFKRVVG